MKTISGKAISSKPVSLSKAAKILSKFVSAENGASQAISVFLHQTSAAFKELNQLHKELKSSRSGQKHKRHRSETHHVSETVVANPIRTIDIGEELNLGAVQSKNKFKRHQFGSEHAAGDVQKQFDNFVSHEHNDDAGYSAGNEGLGEKQKRKKKKQEIKVEAGEHEHNRFEIEEKENDGKIPSKTRNIDEVKPTQSVEFSQEPNDAVDVDGIGTHRKKKKRKQEVDSREFGDNGVQIGEKGDENKLTTKAQVILAQSGPGDNLETEGGRKHRRDKNKGDKVENGGLVDLQESQSKKKKTHEGGHEDKINTKQVNKEQRKKRKNGYVEEKVADRSGEPAKKKMKR